MRIIFLLLILRVTIYATVFAQDSTYHYSIGVSGAISTSSTPFWLQANQNGAVPTTGSFGLVRAGFHKQYNPHNPRFFQWAAGAELIANTGKKSDAFFSDLYLAAKAGPFELSVGQRNQFTGLADSLLTTGSIALSTNYRPYPKIELSTVRFVNIFPMNEIISFKFTYSDGLFGSADVHYGNVSRVPETYFHQKSLYLKLGKNRHRLNLFAGFNHQVMWGGEEEIFAGGLTREQAYSYIVFGKPWAESRVGNHFGTIDVAAEWKGRAWNFFIYRQSIYEDGSLSNLSNLADGLNGFRISRKPGRDAPHALRLNTLLLEFLYTKNQGGNVFDFTTGTYGRDNYFNHYVYNQGWSYRGRSLGTPFVMPNSLVRDHLRTSPSQFTPNNRLLAYHLGISASYMKTYFTIKASHSLNSGTYARAFTPPLRQTSLLFNMDTPLARLKNDRLVVSLAADFGKLLPDNAAVLVGWKKSGFIR